LKKIISFNIANEDKELLSKFCTERKYEYSHIEKIDTLLQIEANCRFSLFFGIGQKTTKEELLSLFSEFDQQTINMIFTTPRFDLLLTCYRYQVNYVFENKLTEVELRSADYKTSFVQGGDLDRIPQNEMLKLFSIPLKIKTNEELYTRIKMYFDHFSSILDFAVLEIDDREFKFYGKHFEPIYEKYISKVTLPKHYVGFEKIFDKGDHSIVLTPTFVNGSLQAWLLIEVKTLEKKFILNDLFYKYLENILIYRKNKEKEKSLKVLAATDEITGLYNQRQLSKDLEHAVKIHEELHENFSIMFIDVDHFKNVNDNYGHVVGSKLLTDMGNALKLILRESDHIYRYGGDEFVIVMPNIDNKTVHEVALRVLHKIKSIDFQIDNGDIYKMSISIGIAEYPTDAKSAIEIIKFADEKMYMSKKSGRGKVFHVNEVNNVDVSTK
jgi:diguanylate cyclase (GGDEF)-like protein